MNKTLVRVFSVLALVSVLLASCSTGSNSAASNEQPLRIAWSLYPGWYPLVIAEKQGLFEKHNVKVELVLLDAYDDTAPQLASGFADGAALVLGDALLDDVGSVATVVLVTDTSDGADQLIASPEVMETGEIAGKRIGLTAGTFGGLLVREMLAANGLTISDITLVEVPPEQVGDSIPESIDIGHTFEPFASQARAKGNGVLFSSADTPGLIVDTIAFRNNILSNRPNDVRNFIKAWFEAVAYWQANPNEGNALIADATGQDVKDVNFEGIKFLDLAANQATFQPGTDRTSALFTAQFDMEYLIDTGLVTTPVDINSVLDPAYLQ